MSAQIVFLTLFLGIVSGQQPIALQVSGPVTQRSVLDASLAKRELGWVPEHSLDEGLAETWAWISSP